LCCGGKAVEIGADASGADSAKDDSRTGRDAPGNDEHRIRPTRCGGL
jgi:hypothetical protein